MENAEDRTEAVAAALRGRGIAAHAGKSWDGFGQYRQGTSPVWYCSPRPGGGVLAHCEVHGDAVYVETEDVPAVLERIAATPGKADRHFVWEALTDKPFRV